MTFDGETEIVEGVVVSPQERIRELEQELQAMKGKGGSGLEGLLANPEKIQSLFAINERQAENLRALLIGGGTGMGVKYLGKSIGDLPAALAGAALSTMLAKKLFGGR